MAETCSLLFATNRDAHLSPGVRPQFGVVATPSTPEGITYARAIVGGIDIASPPSGQVVSIGPLSQARFSDGDLEPLLKSTNDVLAFVHGAANSFDDAITRAGYNQRWIAAAKLSGSNCDQDVIAFTWPSRTYNYADLISDFTSYKADQHAAQASSYHLGTFFRYLYALKPRLGTRRLNLLCHSMGNYALGGAVEDWFKVPGFPVQPLFDQIVLAAPDEEANTFCDAVGKRLYYLLRLGRQIAIYFNRDDVLMHASRIANGNFRLGWEGPPNMADLTYYPARVYTFVDCNGVTDYISSLLDEFDRSHQYYRQSPTVRADIVATLVGQKPRRPPLDERRNCYALTSA